MAAKRNRQLFNDQQLEFFKNHIETLVRSYEDSILEYRKEWERWSAAYNCVYREEDHNAKTDAKLFDPETHDAIDTVSKRINVAMFSNEKITGLEYLDFEDEDLKIIAQATWDKLFDKLNFRKRITPVLLSGIIYGTLIAKVEPIFKKVSKFITRYTESGDLVRDEVVVIDTLPSITPINIFDFVCDPTIESIEDQILFGHKQLMNLSELGNDELYISDHITRYEDMKDYNEKFESRTQSDVDSYKNEMYNISGIDIDSLIINNKRLVYILYMKYTHDDKTENTYYVVVDAVTFDILRIEDNIHDNGLLPFISCPYLIRPGCFYGIGAAEQAWPIQVMLNEILNQYLDNIQLLNSLNFLVGQSGEVEENTPFEVGRWKFISVGNPQKVKQIEPQGLNNIMATVNFAKEEIQRKTKATLLMQGLPVEGSRTATEMRGIREEQNLSIKDIIDNIAANFIEPLLNTWKDAIVQFYEDDEIKIKISVDDFNAKFDVRTIDFDTIRPLLNQSDVKVVSIQEQGEKLNKINELRLLFNLSLERPDILNPLPIMKKLYFDELGIKDMDKLLTNNILPGIPLDPERENLILSGGNPINTNDRDDHILHLNAHLDLRNRLINEAQNNPNIGSDETITSLYEKSLYNINNHIEEHRLKALRLSEESGEVNE